MRQQFESVKQAFFRRKGQADLLRRSLSENEKALADTKATIILEVEVLKLLQGVSASTWNNTKTLVESIVTRALQAIFFDKSYKFVLNQEIKRNVPSVSFAVSDEGMELDIVDEIGGGIADVVALVLRLAFVVLYRPQVRPFLVLDEPLRHLSVSYQPHAAKFLKQVCQELGVSLLVVTHQKELASEADQVFHLEKVGKTCQVR